MILTSEQKMEMQKEYLRTRGLDKVLQAAPLKCYSCHQDVYAKYDSLHVGTNIVSGCRNCHKSFVE